MKRKLIILSILFVVGCKNTTKQEEKESLISIQKNAKYIKFESYVASRLKEIKHDSVLTIYKNSLVPSYILSIIPAREAGFWIFISPNNKSILTNFKNQNIEITGKNYEKIQALINELKKKRDVDETFCFDCYADPTIFVLEEIKSGKPKKIRNVIDDWQSICSKK
jgi:hypothetical protein